MTIHIGAKKNDVAKTVLMPGDPMRAKWAADKFLNDVKQFLKQFPDHNELGSIEKIKAKSSTLPLGIDLKRFDRHKINEKGKLPLILWNHRWITIKTPLPFLK